MSTVPEAIVAAHCSMQVLGLTLCTNMCAGILDQPLSGEEVMEIAALSSKKFSALVRKCLENME
jgi:purine-nucleoside phosphorylase